MPIRRGNPLMNNNKETQRPSTPATSPKPLNQSSSTPTTLAPAKPGLLSDKIDKLSDNVNNISENVNNVSEQNKQVLTGQSQALQATQHNQQSVQGLHGAIKDLISSIAQLKADQAVIQDLLTRVGALEAGMSDEVKRQLTEYLHDFTVTDARLKALVEADGRLHADLTKSYTNLIRAIRAQQIVIDSQVIDQIKRAVEQSTGMDIKAYLTEVQRKLIQQQYKQVEQVQADTLKRTQQINDRVRGLDDHLDALEDRVDRAFDRMAWLVMLVGAGALLVTVPLYITAFDRHPVLTSVLLGLLLVLIVGLLIVQRRDSDER